MDATIKKYPINKDSITKAITEICNIEIGDDEISYLFKMIFDKETIRVWAYNIETILAEKVETILQRDELNTRPRDFYDVYILINTQDFDI